MSVQSYAEAIRRLSGVDNLLAALLRNWKALVLFPQADFNARPRSRPGETVAHLLTTADSIFGMNVRLGKGSEVHDTSHMAERTYTQLQSTGLLACQICCFRR